MLRRVSILVDFDLVSRRKKKNVWTIYVPLTRYITFGKVNLFSLCLTFLICKMRIMTTS